MRYCVTLLHFLFFMISSTSYSFFSLIVVGGGTSSLCWPLNFGSLHHVRRSLLNTLYIVYSSRSSNWNTPKPIFFEILNNLYLFWSSFFEDQFNWMFLFSNHMLFPTFNPWEFFLFLSNCLFIFSWASSINFVVCSQLFCSPMRKFSNLGNSICTTRSLFYGCLPKFSSNEVCPVTVCLLLLYWNSIAASYSIQLSC